MNQPRSSDNQSQDMILGEMRGQLREVVHAVNNLSQKFDGLSREVIGLGVVATKMAEMEARLIKLETADHKREGAVGVVQVMLKSPVVGWVVGAVTAMWALVTGRLHL